jgi:DNA-binding NarL/FixJ family response regulator
MTATTRILVADDHPLFREAIVGRLRHSLGDVQIDEAADYDGVHRLLDADGDVDLLLLDLHMPGAQGLSALVHVRAQYPGLPVVLISAECAPETMARARALGASGYIPKSTPSADMVAAVRRVLAGELAWPADTPVLAPTDLGPEMTSAAQLIAGLTPQQFRIATLLAQGLLNKQIAWELGIAENTVKVHMSTILRKLHVHNRTQVALIMQALEAH